MNYAALLQQRFGPQFQTPPEAWEQFADACEAVRTAKDAVLKPHGAAERFFYFIVRGSAGIFLWKDSHSVCLDFAFDGQFCADYMSLLTRQPTPLELRALEPSELLRMRIEDYDRLTKKSVGSMIRLLSAESSFVDKQQQQIELLTRTAEERYEILLARFPGIANRIAQKHIASYLGITPQSLSRIRKQIR
jgi:CRP-like cAMP-binding protein